MNLYPLLSNFLPLALVSLAPIVPVSAATNNPSCSFAPDALAGFKRTCIASTVYDGKRCFYTYIPDCASSSSQVPLVFDIHGLGSCPLFNTYYTGWKEKADENCFVLVAPTGNTDPKLALETCWAVPGGIPMENDVSTSGCCCTQPYDPFYLKSFEPSLTDDLTFLRQTAAVVVREVPLETSNVVSIDTKRIYMAGHSNGCIASLAMAAVHSDLVAAVGCHAGSLDTPLAENYIATPVWMVIGTADPDVKYNGDDHFPSRIRYLGSETMHSIFTEANECVDTGYQVVNDEGLNSYTKTVSSNCNGGADVVLVALDDVGHTPYLGDKSSDVSNMKGEPVTLDTTQMAWDFVKSHSLANAPTLDDAPPVLDDDDPSSSSCRSVAIYVTLILSMITINLSW